MQVLQQNSQVLTIGNTLSVVLSAATVTCTVVAKFETYSNRKTVPSSAEAFLRKCFRKRLMIVMKTLYDSN
jgi:hypothetical protein